MMNESRWGVVSLSTGIAGMLLYVGGALLGGNRAFGPALQDLGLAMLIAAVLAFLIDRHTHSAMRATVDDAVHRWISATTVSHGCAALDIEGIFVRRGKPDEREQYLHAVQTTLNDAIDHSGTINILCAAGPEFFRNDGPFYRQLYDRLTQSNNQAKIRVLLLQPGSDAARARADLEEGHGTSSDIMIAVKTLNWLGSQTIGRVAYKLLDDPIGNFVILTADTVFHEAYPTAHMVRPDGPIGGLVAMLQYKKTSRAYARWKAHFDYLWEEKAVLPPKISRTNMAASCKP